MRYSKIPIEKGERISKIKYLSNDRLFTTIFVRIFLIDPVIRGTESQSDKGVMNHAAVRSESYKRRGGLFDVTQSVNARQNLVNANRDFLATVNSFSVYEKIIHVRCLLHSDFYRL